MVYNNAADNVRDKSSVRCVRGDYNNHHTVSPTAAQLLVDGLAMPNFTIASNSALAATHRSGASRRDLFATGGPGWDIMLWRMLCFILVLCTGYQQIASTVGIS